MHGLIMKAYSAFHLQGRNIAEDQIFHTTSDHSPEKRTPAERVSVRLAQNSKMQLRTELHFLRV